MNPSILLNQTRSTKVAVVALAIAIATTLMTSAQAQGQSASAESPATRLPDATRGELLYSTHCITCHSDEMHLRVNKLVTDQASLQKQVRRWQGNAALGWPDEDILAVSRYLDARYYHLPPP